MSDTQDSNICTVCGGLIQVEYTITFDRCRPYSIRVEPATRSPFTFCPGHPEPEQKHDGNLDKEGNVHVHFDDDIPFESGCVHLANAWDGGISLLADEALSLLTWLQEHRGTLERVAQQEEYHDR